MRQLLLHFDLNKTIIMSDVASGKSCEDVIQIALAEEDNDNYKRLWDERVQTSMTFYRYVHDVVYPWDPKQDDIKQQRKQMTAKFIDFLQSFDPELHQTVKARFDNIIKAIPSDPNKQILPSFYQLIDWLQAQKENNQFDYTIILRTFGHDLLDVIAELEQHCHLTFSGVDKFFKGEYYVGTDSEQYPLSLESAYQHWQNGTNHYAVQDHYDWWHGKKFREQDIRKSSYGKPFVFASDDPTVISLFFDDNIEHVNEPNIIHPVDLSVKEPVTVPMAIEQGFAQPLNPIQSIENPDFFINKIKATLELYPVSCDSVKHRF